MNYLTDGYTAVPLTPTGTDAWDLFAPIAAPSAMKTWATFGLTIVGSAVGGLCLGYLAAAVIADRVLHHGR